MYYETFLDNVKYAIEHGADMDAMPKIAFDLNMIMADLIDREDEYYVGFIVGAITTLVAAEVQLKGVPVESVDSLLRKTIDVIAERTGLSRDVIAKIIVSDKRAAEMMLAVSVMS